MLINLGDLAIKPEVKKKPENISGSKTTTSSYLVLITIVIGVGAWLAYDKGLLGSDFSFENKKTNTSAINQPQSQSQSQSQASPPVPANKPLPTFKSITLLLFPTQVGTGSPTILNIKRETDLKEFISKIEDELSSENVAVKVMIASDYANTKNDFSDMTNSFLIANLSSLLKLNLKKAPIEPIATISPHVKFACFEEAAILVRADSGINSIGDLKDKRMLVEGVAEAPSIIFNKFTDEVNTEAKGIYSTINFQTEKAPFMEGLRFGVADVLFLNMQAIQFDGYYTILGRLGEQNKLPDFDDLKVLHLTHYRLPCGLLMSSADIPLEARAEFLSNLNKFLEKESNRELFEKNIGIKSFTSTPVETWTKSVEFMNNFSVESPPGKTVLEKIVDIPKVKD